ncbi:hypothetical protein DFJ63DRAFT_22342 [Scheffersomyces coipomensis]|uniref:uncharacterized protein n=1 Tax=Scheffersomyces coipomensis TaxID=1788519 RepID=UPI00315DDFFC
MSLLYHPISSTTVSSRDLTGCLTPNNLSNQSNTRNLKMSNPNTNELYQPKVVIPTTSNYYTKPYFTPTPVPPTKEQQHQSENIGTSSTNNQDSTILSPPISPYQRNVTLNTIKPIITVEEKSYLINSNQEFKIENFKDYKLTIDAFNTNTINEDYKSKQLNFINKYNLISNGQTDIYIPPRKYIKRKLNEYSDNDNNNNNGNNSATESTFERIRTRRIIKNKSTNSDSSDYFEELPMTPPPQKRKRPTTPSTPKRESNNPSPSIALQQQMLIDESIPDFSPDAFETLPTNNNRALKIEWKGQPMDLSQDPNKSKLHPAELNLASILRLPVAVYLDSKRRFFFEKVDRLKQGKQFRRTDAQKACRIDVNKASRLYAAFEKVGWLNDIHFKQYL